MSLQGRIAIVTGGGRGIGLAIAQALASSGADVMIAARNREQLAHAEEALASLSGRVRSHPCDVSRPESIDALAEAAIAAFGAADILVNNAGVSGSAPLDKITLESWNQMFAVNATGTFLCTQRFAPKMVERKWGRIVNIASTAGLQGARYIAAYAASKHAVLGFTRSVAAELEGSGVTTNAVCPGFVDTEMTGRSIANIAAKTGLSSEAALRRMLDAADQPRLVSPEEVARTVLGLCGTPPTDGGSSQLRNGDAIIIDGTEEKGSTS